MKIGVISGIVHLREKSAVLPVPLRIEVTRSFRTSFESPCPLASAVRHRILKTLVPIAKRIAGKRGGVRKGVRFQFRLPASCRLRGEEIEIDGNSADLPIVIAIVSALRREPLEQNTAATGKICGDTGDVEMVRGLAEKLGIDSASLKRVLVPNWRDDAVFARLYPNEAVAIRAAEKGTTLRVILVETIEVAYKIATSTDGTGLITRIAPKPSRRTQREDDLTLLPPQTSPEDRECVRLLIRQFSAKRIGPRVDATIDERVASFGLASSQVGSAAELLEIVRSFVAHVLSDFSADSLSGDSARLLCSTARGSVAAALADVQVGRNGGLRHLLQGIGDQIKSERRSLLLRGMRIQLLDPYDSQRRLALTRAYLAEHWEILPPEMKELPVEEAAGALADYLEATAEVLDSFQRQISRV